MYPGVLTEILERVNTMERRIRSGLPADETLDFATGDAAMNEMGAMPIDTPEKKQHKQITFPNQVCRIRMSEWHEEAMKGKSKIVRDVSLYLDGDGKLLI